MLEIEQKFRIEEGSVDVTELALFRLGFKKFPAVKQVDKVFLSKSDSFKDFKLGDPVTRIRFVDDVATLAYKRAMSSSRMIEHEIIVDPGSEAEEIIREMGFKPVTVVCKTRVEYKLDDLVIAYDKVEKLGSFLEIEIICEESKAEEAEKRLTKFAKKLGLKASQLEPKKYDQLIASLQD